MENRVSSWVRIEHLTRQDGDTKKCITLGTKVRHHCLIHGFPKTVYGRVVESGKYNEAARKAVGTTRAFRVEWDKL